MQTKNVGESFCWQQLSSLHKFPVWVAGQEIPLLWNWNSKLSENTDFFSLPDAENSEVWNGLPFKSCSQLWPSKS